MDGWIIGVQTHTHSLCLSLSLKGAADADQGQGHGAQHPSPGRPLLLRGVLSCVLSVYLSVHVPWGGKGRPLLFRGAFRDVILKGKGRGACRMVGWWMDG